MSQIARSGIAVQLLIQLHQAIRRPLPLSSARRGHESELQQTVPVRAFEQLAILTCIHSALVMPMRGPA